MNWSNDNYKTWLAEECPLNTKISSLEILSCNNDLYFYDTLLEKIKIYLI
jgi:hypothetical protein